MPFRLCNAVYDMSGIAGFYANNIESAKAKNAYSSKHSLDTFQLRDVEASSTWRDRQCELHNVSLVTSVSRERVNELSSRGNWVLTYDGEIYNYKDLKLELIKKGCEFTVGDDTEVLYMAIEVWGIESTLNKIIGIYVFSAYNKKTKDLHIVRDRMGIKSACIYLGDDFFVFGSHSAVIVNGLTQKKWTVDWDSVHSYFMLGGTLQANSLFKGIRRLKPAEHIIINSRMELKSQIYWQPRLRSKLSSDEITSIIQEYSVSDAPVATFLSGGVDSSVVAAALKDKNILPIHFDSSEKKYAQTVANSLGLELSVFDMQLSDDAALDKRICSSGEPVSAVEIDASVSSEGVGGDVKVGLLGSGGDELFLGRASTCIPEIAYDQVSWNKYTEKPFTDLNQQLRWIMRSPELFKVRNVESDYSFQYMRNHIAGSMFLEGFPPSASSRWIDLQMNAESSLFLSSTSMRLRAPFLDHRLVEGALSMNGNDLITMANGRKSPLVEILKKNQISPTVWQRNKLGRNINYKKAGQVDIKYRKAMVSLQDRDIIQNNTAEFDSEQNYNNSRDDRYLIENAYFFSRWLECWEHKLEGI